MTRKKLFGTDGIRGLVSVFPIEPLSLVKLAYAIASAFYKEQKLKCIIGKDTRISGYMIESALVSGLLSKNVDVVFLGPIPSPGVAMLTPSLKADFGIMISASHNPYHDNGIKIFDANGEKLSDELQTHIEDLFYTNHFVHTEEIGKATRLIDCTGRYIEFVKHTLKGPLDLSGMKIVLDCANGSGYKFAPRILEELGAEVITIANKPDGININEKCGATYLKHLSQAVIYYEADLGIALDGDADRMAIVDEKGIAVKGEYVFACLAHILDVNKCVVTSVTNPGLIQYLTEKGVQVFISDVGDREVLALMREEGCVLGGEPSGHFIMSQYLTSSDGMIAALQILKYLVGQEKKASELQKLFVMMNSFEKKMSMADTQKEFTNDDINMYIRQYTDLKNPFVIRKSGTEPALRLHMWSPSNEKLEKEVEKMVAVVEGFLRD